MSADPNIRKKVWRHKRSRFTTLLTIYFFVALIIPNCVLANTEPYSLWTVEALILMPLGFYMMWSVLLRRSGVMIWAGFPFIFFCTFQIVLLYLFGNSIIATDMFTNLLTTNPGEAGELLGNIYPAVVLVLAIYLPLLWFAAREIGHKRYISRTARVTIGLTGASLFVLGALALWPAYHVSERKHVLRDEIFPVNVLYNMGLCGSEFRKAYHFDKTSEHFAYSAVRPDTLPAREIYVYVIGEASRAMSWQLWGYDRPTNPRLSQEQDVVLFRNMLTQSNTTHKSVPLILSSVATDEHEELFRRKGLPALFNEVGFETWFISNQSQQGAMIDHLAHDAQHLVYIRSPRHDMQLLEEMQKTIRKSTSPRLFFILHCYGSHFCYHQRYPRSFARFLPDDNVAIAEQNAEILRNACIPIISLPRLFLICVRSAACRQPFSIAPIMARICWTMSGGVSSMPPPRPPSTSCGSLRWLGSPRITRPRFPASPRWPEAIPTLRPTPMPCSTLWPASLRSAVLISRGRCRWSMPNSTVPRRVII